MRLRTLQIPMHILQPKHTKLKPEEAKKLLDKYNITAAQLPKIHVDDPAIPEDCLPGEIIKIERQNEDKLQLYYRVVVL